MLIIMTTFVGYFLSKTLHSFGLVLETSNEVSFSSLTPFMIHHFSTSHYSSLLSLSFSPFFSPSLSLSLSVSLSFSFIRPSPSLSLFRCECAAKSNIHLRCASISPLPASFVSSFWGDRAHIFSSIEKARCRYLAFARAFGCSPPLIRSVSLGDLQYVVQIFNVSIACSHLPPQELLLVSAVAVLSVLYLLRKVMDAPPKGVKLPPRVPYMIPFVGSAITFGQSPIEFLSDCYKKVNGV